MFEPHKEDEKMKSDAQIKLRLISWKYVQIFFYH